MSRKGFTMVEVLTSVTILSLSAVFINQALLRCVDASRRADEAITASSKTQKEAVERLLKGWSVADER